MLFVTCVNGEYSGHVGDRQFQTCLNYVYEQVIEIQADGDELVKCCEILGRKLPSSRVYTFLGIDAKEISVNWRV